MKEGHNVGLVEGPHPTRTTDDCCCFLTRTCLVLVYGKLWAFNHRYWVPCSIAYFFYERSYALWIHHKLHNLHAWPPVTEWTTILLAPQGSFLLRTYAYTVYTIYKWNGVYFPKWAELTDYIGKCVLF